MCRVPEFNEGGGDADLERMVEAAKTRGWSDERVTRFVSHVLERVERRRAMERANVLATITAEQWRAIAAFASQSGSPTMQGAVQAHERER